MATAAEAIRKIDISLREIAAEAEFLPKLAEEWDQEAEIHRDAWYLEWRELMARLRGLDQVYRSGGMTPDQRDRYQNLLRMLEQATPLLRRLELPLPSVPLEG